jgi:hypothetical protein
MPNHAIQIADLPTTTPTVSIRVHLRYNKGGRCFLTGEIAERGYELSTSPVRLENGIAFIGGRFVGVRQNIEVAKRFSKSRLSDLSETARSQPAYTALLQAVLRRNGLTLKEHAAALPHVTQPAAAG